VYEGRRRGKEVVTGRWGNESRGKQTRSHDIAGRKRGCRKEDARKLGCRGVSGVHSEEKPSAGGRSTEVEFGGKGGETVITKKKKQSDWGEFLFFVGLGGGGE